MGLLHDHVSSELWCGQLTDSPTVFWPVIAVDGGDRQSCAVRPVEHLPVRLIVHNAVTRTFVANRSIPGREEAAKF